jgi:hypothetical protein
MPQGEHEPSSEEAGGLYIQAARFVSERKAGKAYFRAQEAIYSSKADCDLSAYRLILNQRWHVTVIGAPPPQDLDRSLRKILAVGEPTALLAEVITILLQRRAQQTKLAPWIERHHRPGQPL